MNFFRLEHQTLFAEHVFCPLQAHPSSPENAHTEAPPISTASMFFAASNSRWSLNFLRIGSDHTGRFIGVGGIKIAHSHTSPRVDFRQVAKQICAPAAGPDKSILDLIVSRFDFPG